MPLLLHYTYNTVAGMVKCERRWLTCMPPLSAGWLQDTLSCCSSPILRVKPMFKHINFASPRGRCRSLPLEFCTGSPLLIALYKAI
jgi:hypothetical protein